MSWIKISGACALACALLAAPAAAQEEQEMAGGTDQAAMMAAWQKAMAVGEPHAAMAEAEGSWKMTIRMWMNPAGEPMSSTGSAEREMTLGGRVMVETMTADMMGMPFEGVGRRGYDNVTGKYWATWTDSMSTGLFVSRGELAEDGRIIFHGEFEDPMTGGTTKARAAVTRKDDNTELFEWFEDRGEGEVKTMEIVYERQVEAAPEAAAAEQ